MGYIPPPPGSFPMLESGLEMIEVTCLEDDGPRYVPRYGRVALREDVTDRYLAVSHQISMERMHAETLRQARVGTFLLLALAADLIAMVWTGL